MKRVSVSAILFQIVLFLLIACFPAHAQNWYDPGWHYRKAIIINADKVVADLGDFPLLVKVTDADLASYAQADGDDILFTGIDGITRLDHEIESYAGGSGALVAWVRIPNLSSTVNTVIHLYYGNPAASSQESPTGVWDSNHVMVQHLEETAGTDYDSTGNANHGTTVVVSNHNAAGMINGADEFNGSSNYARVPNAPSLQFGAGSFTAEAWIYPHSAPGTEGVRIVNNRGTGLGGDYAGWQLKIAHSGGNWVVGRSAIDDATDKFKIYDGTTTYTYNQWYQVVMVYEADQELRFYVNGNLDGTLPVGSYGSISNTLPTVIGAALANNGVEGGAPTQAFDGRIDEVRLSNTARSAAWIETSYNNQHDPGSFYQITGANPSAVWVDDDYCAGCPNNGHLWGYDAFDSIQGGIDAVPDGGTVNVAGGTYTEPVNIDGRRGVTLHGADKTALIVYPASTLAWNACGYTTNRTAVFRIVNSTDVVLQNMTMDFALVKANSVFGIFGCDSEVTVNNCILKNMSVPDASGGYYELGTYFRAPGFTDEDRAAITITNNTFVDTGRVGVVTHDYSYATIEGNTFYKTTNDFGYALELGSRSKGVIRNNVIYGYDTPAASDGSESAGIYIENAFTGRCCGGPGPHVEKNVTVQNNEVYDCQYAMWIGNGYNTYAGDVDIVVSLIGNNFHDNRDGGVIIQDEDKADGSSVTVTGSGNRVTGNGGNGYNIFTQGDGAVTVILLGETISDNDTGIGVSDTAGVSSNSSYRASITLSDIIDNTSYGINNAVSTFLIDAEWNWWGDESGPYDGVGTHAVPPCTDDPTTEVNTDGTGNAAGGNVDYCPWQPYQNPDFDDDGICNPHATGPSCTGSDNCMLAYNPAQEDTDGSGIGDACNDDIDADGEEWEDSIDNCPFHTNPGQEDNYPPGGNGIGDSCECEADFECDRDVDGTDASSFKLYFGRNQLFYPCNNLTPCRGDFECDGDVDGTDASRFKQDFGRSLFRNPCPPSPPCAQPDWCSY